MPRKPDHGECCYRTLLEHKNTPLLASQQFNDKPTLLLHTDNIYCNFP